MCLAFLLSYFGVSRIFPPRLAKTAEFTTEAKGQVRPTPQVYHVTMLNRCTRRSCWRWRYCITWDLRLNLRWACDFHLQWASKCMVFGRRSFFVRVIQVCWELSGDTWWEMWQEDSDAHEQRPNLNYKLYLQNLPRFFLHWCIFSFLKVKVASCWWRVRLDSGLQNVILGLENVVVLCASQDLKLVWWKVSWYLVNFLWTTSFPRRFRNHPFEPNGVSLARWQCMCARVPGCAGWMWAVIKRTEQGKP